VERRDSANLQLSRLTSTARWHSTNSTETICSMSNSHTYFVRTLERCSREFPNDYVILRQADGGRKIGSRVPRTDPHSQGQYKPAVRILAHSKSKLARKQLTRISSTSNTVDVQFIPPVTVSQPRCSIISVHFICLSIYFHIYTCVL